MGSAAELIPSSAVRESFETLEKQRELITSCTALWKELSDHFSTLERGLQLRSDSLRSRRESLDASTKRTLDSLNRREHSIDTSVRIALAKLEDRRLAALHALSSTDSAEADDLSAKLRSLSTKMDTEGFFDLLASKKKEVDVLRSEVPVALADCIDPAKFVIDAISMVFPVDRRVVKTSNDYGWVCVLILESLVPVLADPQLGESRSLVTVAVKERAKEMADEWKGGLEKLGGIDGTKPSSAHAFLQHVVTFGIAVKEDKELYRMLILAFAWRRQMPKLALLLGFEDSMTDMIEELINKGQHLDAINFAYEAGLQDKFPPIPLLKSFLKDSKKTASSISEERSSPVRSTTYNGGRREQSAIRAVMKCIEDRNLEAEFPVQNLQKRLEQLEKVKAEKKKSPSPNSPANKRTRANNGGPMPPAKAGRLTNNAYVSSFPAAPTYVRSPSHHTYPAAASPYGQVGNGAYGSRSPPAIRDPYGYPAEEMSPHARGAPYLPAPLQYPPVAPASFAPAPTSYPSPPMTYPTYGGYSNGLAPAYQQGYYR
ncbi:FRIGIDA-like protein 4a [Dioscorea cayenensis subsp. rotundata]|uniref:FRIGIDA-like protein n=1 Tax=Dioscorea cayennensis subsp. rotundata TaxID=55577 RepID=A0AB40AUH9_DIOCR|nr:FRIGIDA-like protein 4a [Dioscorea cayenensis subsp. rotundata]